MTQLQLQLPVFGGGVKRKFGTAGSFVGGKKRSYIVDEILFMYNKYNGIMYQLVTYRSKWFLVIIPN